jgi:hypothetical protein
MSTVPLLLDGIETEIQRRTRFNHWFEMQSMQVYLRMSQRSLEGKIRPTLDIANIEVRELYQGQGIFSEFLMGMELLAGKYGKAIYVENVGNPILQRFLIKRGYIQQGDMLPCFYHL